MRHRKRWNRRNLGRLGARGGKGGFTFRPLIDGRDHRLDGGGVGSDNWANMSHNTKLSREQEPTGNRINVTMVSAGIEE